MSYHEQLSAQLLQFGGKLIGLSGRILLDLDTEDVLREARECALRITMVVSEFEARRSAS